MHSWTWNLFGLRGELTLKPAESRGGHFLSVIQRLHCRLKAVDVHGGIAIVSTPHSSSRSSFCRRRPPPPPPPHCQTLNPTPCKPSKLSKPSKPWKPYKPSEPSKPSKPSKPWKPSKPSNPSKPYPPEGLCRVADREALDRSRPYLWGFWHQRGFGF